MQHKIDTLGDDIRRWVKTQRWFEITAENNQGTLDRHFGGIIETLARELDTLDLQKLRRTLLDCWDHLAAKCMKIDALCRTGCRSQADRLELEILRSKAVGAAYELAEVIDLVATAEGAACTEIQPRKPQPIKTIQPAGAQWITYAEAAELLAVDKSTVSRWVKRGTLESNGETGRRRRVDKTSVLLKKQAISDEYARQDERDIRQDRRRFG